MGLSLWLVPDKKNAEGLITIMNAVENNGSLSPASYPKFYPHITLASFPSTMARCLETIGTSIPTLGTPLRCHFASVHVGSHYFRSVYIAIKPTLEIVDLRRRVHAALGVEPRTPSFPHLSLCYIDDADAEKGEREAFYKVLREGGNFKKEIGCDGKDTGVSLNLSFDPEVENWSACVDVSEVWVAQCEGPVEGWTVLGKYPLAE
ncbi:unnamed protein product [Cyclocybe aegerita]|uniref:2',3'-cyclic-nucleotide 3'-phosphodiesterase n=1 Tax=Cyclocybe aegerita TaxID=1973307 RepID=A0A8S0VV91_CYCAE|nr:unnamed protein product [Cyclocybe aegerita]